jgi:hypothetical protein
MGEKCSSRQKTKRLLFSRLEHPENLARLTQKVGSGTATYKDSYLMSLGQLSSSPEQMCQQVGCAPPSPSPAAQ